MENNDRSWIVRAMSGRTISNLSLTVAEAEAARLRALGIECEIARNEATAQAHRDRSPRK